MKIANGTRRYLTRILKFGINETVRLSTKSTYGLRAMMNIALDFQRGATSVAEISKKEGISSMYLEQLLNRLRRRGLVNSIRGPKGGYVLSRRPERITVADIVRALEGNMYPVHCVTAKKDLDRSCRRSKACVPKVVWIKLAKAINDCLKSITLEGLCIEAERFDK